MKVGETRTPRKEAPRPLCMPFLTRRVHLAVHILLGVRAKLLQACLTLGRHPVGCSLPGSSVHGILQAKILEWDLPNPGIKPLSLMSPALEGGFFTTSATWEALSFYNTLMI